MGILDIDLNDNNFDEYNNFDNNNCDKDDPDTIVLVNLKNVKHLKKELNEELMREKICFGSIQNGGIETFCLWRY